MDEPNIDEVAVDAPEERRHRALRHTATVIGVVVLFAVLATVATTKLGRNASSKFSSVSSAICATRVGGNHQRVVPMAVVTPVAIIVRSAGVEHETASSSCGGPVLADSSARPTAASVPAHVLGQPGGAPAPTADAAAAPEVPAGPSVLEPGPAAGHAFISTATMTVKVDDVKVVNQKKEEAVRLVEGSGGGLFGEQTSFNGDAHATVTFKVPPAKFRPLLSTLAGLGVLQEQEVKTDDVTQQVIDLDARIIAAEAGLDRMRGLLSKAADLNQVATLEADVSRRQTEVEQLKGEQRTLGQRVDLATIVLTLTATSTGPGVATAPISSTGATTSTTKAPPKPLPGFADGLETGWSVFTTVGSVALACLGAALPFLPFLLLGLVTWRLVRRRRSSPNRARPAGAPAG